MSAYQVHIWIRNIEPHASKLSSAHFSMIEIDGTNFGSYRELFGSVDIYRGDYVIERHYETLPKPPDGVEDFSGLGGIPYESEDLMLLLRLFKPGDIVFGGQVIRTPEGGLVKQVQYPMCFSSHHSSFPYEIRQDQLPEFELLFADARVWPGWNSAWFRVARKYFLWGGSKEFHPERATERVLDYLIALEAALVPEGDFVSRRLRQRGAALLGRTEEETLQITRRLGEYYSIRSSLAHGNPISDKQVEFLKMTHRKFEHDVRELLKELLESCPCEDDARREYLCALFDISDFDRAEKMISDFKLIKNPEARRYLLRKLKS